MKVLPERRPCLSLGGWPQVVLLLTLLATPAALATSLTATDEETCPAGGSGIVRVRVDTEGTTLGSAGWSLAFDDDRLRVVAVFPTGFTAADYTIDWSVQEDPGGPDTLVIELSTGTPRTPDPGEELVWIALESLGTAGIDPLVFDASATTIDGAPVDVLVDGSIAGIAADVAIRIPDDRTAEAGATVSIPVVADPADDLSSFDLTVEFDPGVFRFQTASTTATTSNFFITSNEIRPGRVAVALFDLGGGSIPPGTGAVPIVELSFTALGTAGQTSALDLTRGITDDGVSTCRDDGQLAICADADGDGFAACPPADDCDDDDPDVYPGAPELCDGRDNQCPGDAGFDEVDEGFDSDGDLIASCFDNCPDIANPEQHDLDGDGQGDACDCAPDNPANPLPAPVSNSLVGRRVGSVAEFEWDDQGLPGEFLVYRGTRDVADAFAYDQSCLGPALASPELSDPEVPIPQRMFTYLIARRDACGESGIGTASDGAARPNDSSCP